MARSVSRRLSQALRAHSNKIRGVDGAGTKHDALGSFIVDAGGQNAEARRTRFIVLPSSKRYIAWSMVLGLFIVFFLVAVPMRFAFGGTSSSSFIQSTGPWFAVDVVADCVFLVDLLISFRTAVKKDGVLVLDWRAIAVSYLRSWFLLDLVASVPTSLLELASSSDSADAEDDNADLTQINKLLRGGRIGKLLRVLRIFKLLRVARLSRSFQHLQAYALVNPSFLRFVRIMGMLAVLWHLIACTYYYIAQIEGFCDWNPDNMPLNSTWYEWGSAGDTPNGFQECDGDWVPWVQLTREPLLTQYSQAFFWAVQVTTGVGKDIIPQTDLETIFTIVSIVIGVIISAVIIGSLASALQNVDAMEALRRQHMESVSAFLREKGVPVALQRQIVDFYEYYHGRRKQQGESDLFHELPAALKIRLKVAISRRRVESVPLFRGLPPDCVISLIHKLRTMVTIPRQYLAHQGEIGGDLFIIAAGTCHAVMRPPAQEHQSRWQQLRTKMRHDTWRELYQKLRSSREEVFLHKLEEGDFFGENAILGQRNEESVFAASFCDLLILPVDGLHEVMKTFPALATRIQKDTDLEKIESRWEERDPLNLCRENTAAAAGPSGPGRDGGGSKMKKKGRRPSALLSQLRRAQQQQEQEASPAAPGQSSADSGESQTPAEAAAAGDDDVGWERREQELLDRVLRLEQRLVEVVRQRDRAIGERYLLQKRLEEHARSAAPE